tara:strand:- start:97 stop:399 length:303 start_codon:yes stop_codon:yes gene_type:complete
MEPDKNKPTLDYEDDDKRRDMSITSEPSTPQKPSVDDTYKDDDWFDADKYKQAAQIAYDFSIGKMREAGDQERKTDAQQQAFREKDEERDYKQSQKGYRF